MKYQELLNQLTVVELTSIYNALATAKVTADADLVAIDHFPSKQDGVKRLMYIISQTHLTMADIAKLVPEDLVRKKIENMITQQAATQRVARSGTNVRPVNTTAAVAPATAGKKIVLIAQTNPKRKGSASYERYAKYVNGMTVADALKAGVTKADLQWDQKKGFIKLED